MAAWTEDIVALIGARPVPATALLDGSTGVDAAAPEPVEREEGIDVASRPADDGLVESVRMARRSEGDVVGAAVQVRVGLPRRPSRADDVVAVAGAIVGFAFALALAFAVTSFLPHGGWQRIIAAVVTMVVWPLGAALFIAPVDAVRRRALRRREDEALAKYGRPRFDALVASVRARLGSDV